MWRPQLKIVALAALPVLLLTGGVTYLLRMSSTTGVAISSPSAAAVLGSAAASSGEPGEPGGPAGTAAPVGSAGSAGPGTAPGTSASPGTSTSHSPGSAPGSTAGAAPGTTIGTSPGTSPGQTPAAPGQSPSPVNPPKPERATITVGGVRLDNSVPNDDRCLTFTNTGFDQPVRVVGADVPDGPAFMIASESERCQDPDLLGHSFRSCDGATLQPGGTGCDSGVGVRPGGPPESDGGLKAVLYTGTLQLTLRATCTSRTGQPCASLPARFAPSAAAPVEVTWTDPGRTRSLLVDEEPPSPSPNGG
ncbi:hypothetical protein FB565_006800 [Actinoplanes lutulentus]|uniref:Uncharacterized protein n=1 Tax=Actinoplanes lutulentus TaxID=1287878 RepID=A0A327Z4H8_9ACTN|nr:hypothetical protein [Actinoplanes lutulentus]MBB2947032.1 hypothetical protein [Actinoplanes lutulentus]RAK30531.1 hypothetical protein B0I29_116190 [Actinoplanes lutulentus]